MTKPQQPQVINNNANKIGIMETKNLKPRPPPPSIPHNPNPAKK